MSNGAKLTLEDLKVQSFVTVLDDELKAEYAGGGNTCSPSFTWDQCNFSACCVTAGSSCAVSMCPGTDGYCTCETGCSVTHCK